ncbi:MAG: hypothetical protein AAGA37_09280 [Actinomycetota bacterium]
MISQRASDVLDRFPSCLDVDNPEKVFAFVVNELSREVDLASSSSGRIRRNHRVGAVDNEWDLHRLAALHGLRPRIYEPLQRRLNHAWALTTRLSGSADEAAALEVRAELPDALGVPADAFDPLGAEEQAEADALLVEALADLATYPSEMAQRRTLVQELIVVHREGNATVRALLRATAALLGLEMLDPITDHPDRYWHFVSCRDRMAVHRGSNAIEPIQDLLAIEENPFQPADVQPSPKWSRQQFSITRAGWEEVPVTVRVIGIEDRCWGPMVVNLETGAGVRFAGAVPDGSELRFERTGQVTLDGSGVASLAFSFQGGVFADAVPHPNAFVWADADQPDDFGNRAATFTQTSPVDAGFARTTNLPHGGGLLDAPTLLPDKTRFAFFVQEGHFGGGVFGTEDTSATTEVAAATHFAGIFDASVFDPRTVGGTRDASAEVGLEWEEREAFAVCVWLPRRFMTLDDEGSETIAEQVRILLDRYRAAGVHVRVKYADDRWELGTGVVRDTDSTDPIGLVVAGTTTWPDPTEADG